MTQPPAEFRNAAKTVMSNFDHRIDRSLEQRLRHEKVFGQYTGRDFCGDVWFQDGHFHCLVRIRGISRKTFSATTLKAIMSTVCSEYGSA